MTNFDTIRNVLALPAIQYELGTIHGDEVELLATLLDLDDSISGLPFAQSRDDRDAWTLLLVSQTVARTGGMAEYRELLRALRPATPGVGDDIGAHLQTRQARGWEITWRRTRDLREVTRAGLLGAKICRWSIKDDWVWMNPETGGITSYHPCPGGAAESQRVEDGRLIVEWYDGEENEPEATVELASAGGWIEILTVHRTPDPEDLTHSEIAALVAAEQ
jgi:hypothetical protein